MPATEKTTETAKVLNILKKLYTEKYIRVAPAATETGIDEQAVRRILLNMKKEGWVEKTKDGATDLFYLTSGALLDEHVAVMDSIIQNITDNVTEKITEFLETIMANITEKINQFNPKGEESDGK